MNYEHPVLCKHCATPVQISLPIWVTPGDDTIDTNEIDWEANKDKTYCRTCGKTEVEVVDNENVYVLLRQTSETLSDADDRDASPAGVDGLVFYDVPKALWESPVKVILDWFHGSVAIGCVDDFDWYVVRDGEEEREDEIG